VDGHLHPRARELADAVRAGVRGLQVRSAVLIGEGVDNLAYEVNGELGTFLAAVHAAPLAQMATFVGPDEVPMAQWQDEAAGHYTAVISAIPADRRGAVEAFLAASPPDRGGAVVFCHNDLGIEHVLVAPDSGAITGVIDWSDAALTDPARDFGLVHRDLGPAALAAALTNYPAGDTAALRERAAFYAAVRPS
jgi:aminoglycoside phosphotransferase (APT) family kinase protein